MWCSGRQQSQRSAGSMPMRAAEPSALQSWFAVGQLDRPRPSRRSRRCGSRSGRRRASSALASVASGARAASPTCVRVVDRRPGPRALEALRSISASVSARVERHRHRAEPDQRVQEHDVVGGLARARAPTRPAVPAPSAASRRAARPARPRARRTSASLARRPARAGPAWWRRSREPVGELHAVRAIVAARVKDRSPTGGSMAYRLDR